MSDTDYTLIPLGHAILNNQTVDAVNARDLHSFLEVGKDFSTWFKNRVEQYSFAEGTDFTQAIDFKAPQNGGAPESTTYGQGRIDYYVSMDMAKELSMVERNAKGKEAREYFIKCEKKLYSQEVEQPKALSTLELFDLQLKVTKEHDFRLTTMEKKVVALTATTEEKITAIETKLNTPLELKVVPHLDGYVPIDTTGKFLTVRAFVSLYYRRAQFSPFRFSAWSRSIRVRCEKRSIRFYGSRTPKGTWQDLEFPVWVLIEVFKEWFPNYVEGAYWAQQPTFEMKKAA